MLPFQDQTPSSLSPLVENDPAAETREGNPSSIRGNPSKASLLGCKRMLETKSEMSIIPK
jgi:hypothetical protein